MAMALSWRRCRQHQKMMDRMRAEARAAHRARLAAEAELRQAQAAQTQASRDVEHAERQAARTADVIEHNHFTELLSAAMRRRAT